MHELVGHGLLLDRHRHQLRIEAHLRHPVGRHGVAPVAGPAADHEQPRRHLPQHTPSQLVVLLRIGTFRERADRAVLDGHAADATRETRHARPVPGNTSGSRELSGIETTCGVEPTVAVVSAPESVSTPQSPLLRQRQGCRYIALPRPDGCGLARWVQRQRGDHARGRGRTAGVIHCSLDEALTLLAALEDARDALSRATTWRRWSAWRRRFAC